MTLTMASNRTWELQSQRTTPDTSGCAQNSSELTTPRMRGPSETTREMCEGSLTRRHSMHSLPGTPRRSKKVTLNWKMSNDTTSCSRPVIGVRHLTSNEAAGTRRQPKSF
nr:MAG: hypothetical protein [Lesnoe mivirus]